MIRVSRIMKSDKYCSCDHWNIEGQPFYLKYEFINKPKREEPYVELTLCEDCSCMMSRLHFDCMENGDPYEYDTNVGYPRMTNPQVPLYSKYSNTDEQRFYEYNGITWEEYTE